MRFFTLLIILAVFFQTTFLPLNVSLILLLARSLYTDDRRNLYLAFFAGISLGILSSANIGFWPLVFVVVVKIAHGLGKLPAIVNVLTTIPVALILAGSSGLVSAVVLGQSLNYTAVIFESVLVLPVYILLRFWEERFVVKPALKLKIKG